MSDAREGRLVTARISVSLPSDMATKAIGDGSKATELIFRAYDAGGKHLEQLDCTETISDGQASFSAPFVRGMEYKLVFWAQTPGQYTIGEDQNGHPRITLGASVLQNMMNNDAYDAFYGVSDFVALG